MMSQVTSMTLTLGAFVVANVPLANPFPLLLSLAWFRSRIFLLALTFFSSLFLSFRPSLFPSLFVSLLSLSSFFSSPFPSASSSCLESSVVCCIARARIDAAWILEPLPNLQDSSFSST